MMMDYEAQQQQEIEALQAIYQEDELELISAQYPEISLRIKLNSGQDGEELDNDFRVALLIELPSNYPDVIPRISLEGYRRYLQHRTNTKSCQG
ncbi:hypothetical protein KIN20_019769 [Parelaphostrongylus tenuis]|uniref:RWD domain-containing protein n=1 Tax=Parelaphostrongylus tenuis TaxID=148309 RepID=A0AAD5MQ27_PARTN|nr:hypothetical protein KIN20_019769 [Parelaphostrongylus tenuis]